MTISFPLSLPSSIAPARVDFRAETNVGEAQSPFSFSQQTFAWAGAERWLAAIAWGEMTREFGDDIQAFMLALDGRRGSFLLGDLRRPTPRGTWSGQTPLVAGASQTGKTLAIDGMSAGSTGIAGDWFQLGSGANSRLYRLTAGFTADGLGAATIDFWPSLRGSPADNAPLTLAAARGLFMLANNTRGWFSVDVRDAGMSIDCVEDLRGL